MRKNDAVPQPGALVVDPGAGKAGIAARLCWPSSRKQGGDKVDAVAVALPALLESMRAGRGVRR